MLTRMIFSLEYRITRRKRRKKSRYKRRLDKFWWIAKKKKKKREVEDEACTVGGTLVLSSWKCLKPRGLSVLTKRTFGEKKREGERERKSSEVLVHDKIEFSAMVTSSTEHATGPIQIYTPESWPRNTMSFCAALINRARTCSREK